MHKKYPNLHKIFKSMNSFQKMYANMKKYVNLKKLNEFEKNTQSLKKYTNLKNTWTWKKNAHLRSTQIFRKFTYLNKVPEFENITRTWKKYVDLSRRGQNRGGTAQKSVKTMTMDVSCMISVVKGASCPVWNLRDQIYTPPGIEERKVYFCLE